MGDYFLGGPPHCIGYTLSTNASILQFVLLITSTIRIVAYIAGRRARINCVITFLVYTRHLMYFLYSVRVSANIRLASQDSHAYSVVYIVYTLINRQPHDTYIRCCLDIPCSTVVYMHEPSCWLWSALQAVSRLFRQDAICQWPAISHQKRLKTKPGYWEG